MTRMPKSSSYTLPCLKKENDCHQAEVLELHWTIMHWVTAVCAPFAHSNSLFAGIAAQELSDLALDTAWMLVGEGPIAASTVVRRVTGLVLIWDAAERRRLAPTSTAGADGGLSSQRAFSLPKVAF